jgi:hypothetical protein
MIYDPLVYVDPTAAAAGAGHKLARDRRHHLEPGPPRRQVSTALISRPTT